MKKLSLVLSLFVSLSVFAADNGGGFKAPPPFTLLDCATDGRAADGPYFELVIHRVGQGPYEVVTYESYVPEGEAFPSGVRRKVVAASVGCFKAYTGGFPIRCVGDKFDLTVEATKEGYSAKWTGGAAYTFGGNFISSCKLLN